MIPRHLHELAVMADRTPAKVRPDGAARVAALMLLCLPRDEPEVCQRRLLTLTREIQEVGGTP